MTIAATEFEFICRLVERQAGIVLGAGKEYLVESRLAGLLRRENIASFGDLITKLKQSPISPLTKKTIDAMTTNETSFYRDIHPFEALKKTLLPELIAKRAATKTLNFWCAASSTGQEPYSVCILLREHFPQLADWRINFVATDLCTDALTKAREGMYSTLEVNRGLPAPLLVKYFTKAGMEWKLDEKIRRMVTLKEMNITGHWSDIPVCDIIFIRNILIYFSLETKKVILGKAAKLLRPDGYLFLGGAETTVNVDDSYERVQLDKSGCYRPRALQPMATAKAA